MTVTEPIANRDELFEATAPLRRLARGLLYDPHRADDVVQEAWLAFLRKDPPRGTGIGGWLAGAVRRLARNEQRRNARRQARDGIAARRAPEGDVEGVDVALERLELLRRIGDAVEALDEPYRSTILLRYFEDVPAREIARRTQVPLGTVQTRLRRGLARLRMRLDPGGREGGAIALALAPLAGPLPLSVGLGGLLPNGAGTASPVTGIDSMWKGALLMKGKVAVIGLVCLAGVGWYLQRPEEPGPPPVRDERAQVAAPSTATAGSRDRARATDTASAASTESSAAMRSTVHTAPTTADATPTWRIRGTVTEGTSVPLGGARVTARIHAGDDLAGTPLASAELRADDTGAFAWSVPPPPLPCTVHVQVTGKTHFGAPTVERVSQGDDAPVDLVVRAFPSDAVLVGRLLTPDGEPIEGARVSGSSHDATTDAAGTYRVKGTSLLPERTLWAIATGFAEEQITVAPSSPGENRVEDRVLTPEVVLTGSVRDAAGEPITGAHVLASYANRISTRTDETGTFTLQHVSPDEHIQLRVRADGFASYQSVSTAAMRRAPFHVTLHRGGTLAGRVRFDDGRPAPGVKLVVGFHPNALDVKQTHTGADGAFELAGLPTGSQTVWATRKGWLTEKRRLDFAEGAKESLDLVLERGLTGTGLVLDEHDEPLPYAPVFVRSVARAELAVPPVLTDASGRFELPGLPDARIRIGALTLHYAETVREVHAREAVDLVLRLERTGGLHGRVIDDVTGAPVTRFRVRLNPTRRSTEANDLARDPTWRDPGYPFDNADGLWRTTPSLLRSGTTVDVEVRAEGYAPRVVGNVPVNAALDTDDVIVRLVPGASVHGVVTDTAGRPLAGAKVIPFSGAEPLPPHGILGRRRNVGVTDERGRFEVTGLAGGDLSLAVRSDEAMEAIEGPFHLAPGARRELRIELETGARLEALLVDEEGQPIADAKLQLLATKTRGAPYQRWAAQTDARGRATFEHLMPGNYQLAWYVQESYRIVKLLEDHVRIGTERDNVKVLRPRGTGKVRGTLHFDGDLPTFLQVRLSPTMEAGIPDELTLSCTRSVVADDYLFEAAGLCEGEYQVGVHHTDHTTGRTIRGSARVHVSARTPTEVQVPLREER